MVIGYGTTAGTLGELTVNSGLAQVRHIRLNNSGSANVTGVIRLNGGILDTYAIRTGFSTISAGGREVYLNGGTLRAAFANQPNWISNNVNVWVQNGGAVFDTAGYTYGLGANLQPDVASTGGLTKNGAGILRLSGTNTYTGTTTVNAGTLMVAGTNSLPGYSTSGMLSVAGGATLGVGYGGSNEWADTDVSALLSNNGGGFAAGSHLGFDTASGDATNGTAIALTAMGLKKLGANTLTLTGASSYQGLTTVSEGMLCAANASALGSTGNGTVVENNARLALAGGVAITGEALTITGNGGDSFGALRSIDGVNEWAGPVTLGADEARLAAYGGDLIISGPIGDNGYSYGPLIRTSNGNLTDALVLSGASTYGGATMIYQGLVRLGGGNDRLPVGTVLSLGFYNTGNPLVGHLDLNGMNQELAGLQVHSSVTDPGQIAQQVVTNSAAGLSTLTLNQTADYTYSGRLEGNLALVKTGAGTLVLSGTNGYTGTTSVDGGTLQVDGSLAGGGNVTVANEAKLSGSGSVAGLITMSSGATLAPGTSPGTLTVSNGLSMASGSTFEVELTGTLAGQFDVVQMTGGTLTLSGGGISVLGDDVTYDVGTTFTVLQGYGSRSGTFGVTEVAGSGMGGNVYSILYDQGSGANELVLQVIPEPAALGALGLLAAAMLLRRRPREQESR